MHCRQTDRSMGWSVGRVCRAVHVFNAAALPCLQCVASCAALHLHLHPEGPAWGECSSLPRSTPFILVFWVVVAFLVACLHWFKPSLQWNGRNEGRNRLQPVPGSQLVVSHGLHSGSRCAGFLSRVHGLNRVDSSLHRSCITDRTHIDR